MIFNIRWLELLQNFMVTKTFSAEGTTLNTFIGNVYQSYLVY